MKNSHRSGYTLVEILAVIGLMIAIMALAIPALGNIRTAAWLNEAAETVNQQLLLARQQSINKGVVAEVRFLKQDDRWLGVQTVIYRHDDVVEPLTGVAKFPESIGIEPSATFSPLLASLNTGTATLNQYGAVEWHGLSFMPSGEVAGDPTATALDASTAFLTLVLNRDLNTPRPAGTPPPNYATVKVTPATGRVTVYRP